MLWLIALALVVSAALLFLIQPIVGKLLLPKFGGTPFVWVTSMLFFQSALLAGYVYVHLATTRLSSHKQKMVHLLLLALALLALPLAWLLWPFAAAPLGIAESWAPPGDGQPVFWLVLVLTLTIGLPFTALAATTPLLLHWFAGTDRTSARDPYYLYAASNLGSLCALLAYPWLVEPLLGLSTQGWLWLVGLVIVSGLVLYSLSLLSWHGPSIERSAAEMQPEALDPRPTRDLTAITAQPVPPLRSARSLPEEPCRSLVATELEVTPGRRIAWVAYAFVPSSLMLALTTHFTTDISPVPLFWVIPLAVYLLSMVVAFARLPGVIFRIFVLIMPVPVLVVLYTSMVGFRLRLEPMTLFYYHLAVLFAVGLTFHGAIAQSRPRPHHLTEFYVWLALGGLLGGIANALLAPVLFKHTWEYTATLVLACLLMPPLGNSRPVRLGWLPTIVLLLGLLLAGLGLLSAENAGVLRELLERPPDQAGHALLALLLLSPLAAVVAPFLVRQEKAEAAFDFIVPVAAAPCALLVLLHRSGSRTNDDLAPLLFACVMLFLATAARLVVLAVQGQLWRSIVLAWPLLFSLNLAFKLWMVLASFPADDVLDIGRPGRAPVQVSPYTYLIGIPLLLAIVSIDRPVRFGLSLAFVVLVHAFYQSDSQHVLHEERSAFGVLRVEARTPFDHVPLLQDGTVYHRLLQGSTLQGMQQRDSLPLLLLPLTATNPLDAAVLTCGGREESAALRRMPLCYYHPTGPLGEVLANLEKRTDPPAIAALGLGAGALASYGRPGQELTFYEIDPTVIRVARTPDLFTYLADAEQRGVHLKTIAGDGRLQLARAPDSYFNLIVLDAFNSDAVPTHLLTREAIATYVRKLAPGGVIACHVSNRYLDLPPVLRDLADDAGLAALQRYDEDEKPSGKNASDWVILARKQADLDAVVDSSRWQKPTTRGARLWTDDYSNILEAFRRARSLSSALDE